MFQNFFNSGSLVYNNPKKSFVYSNNKAFEELTLEQRINTGYGTEDIENYSIDLKNITKIYSYDYENVANINQLIPYIKSFKHGYNYYKQIFISIIKNILIILQLVFILYYNYPKHICIENEIDKNDEKYWICSNEIGKCKVKEIIFDEEGILRIIYLLFFDLIYIIQDLKFAITLKKKSSNLYIVIIYPIFEYLILLIIYFFLF